MSRSSKKLASPPWSDRWTRGAAPVGVVAAREERRTVTIVFVDMVGFTTRTEDLDPEDVRDLQREYFRSVSNVLRRWNGVVEKYVGDAVMAVFGAPVSTDHDAYRAVRAGLEIQELFGGSGRPICGAPVQVRVGITTGEAMVDLVAATDGGQALVSGAVVSTAARVQASAPVGTVVVTAATREATGALIRYAELPAVTVTARTGPRAVWRACAIIPTPGAGRVHEATPMIGRAVELRTITGRIEHSMRSGVPVWVSVVGPAGSGKSRLVHELVGGFSEVAGRAVGWRVARCTPWGAHGAPAADLVSSSIGIGERMLAAAAQRPLVLVVDDLHWADPSLRAFLSDLYAAAVRGCVPLAIVVTERGTAGSHQASPAARCTVALRPLGAADTRELLAGLLSRGGQEPDLVDRLLPLVGGNPGYAHEYVRMIAEGAHLAGDPRSDGDDLPAPQPVRRVVAAELDRLHNADRRAVQAAAILGESVRAEAVAHLLRVGAVHAGAVLRRLVTSGVLVEQGSAPGGSPEYGFSAPAVRQVAYGQLSRATRAEYHRLAAQWLVATAEGDRADTIGARARHEVAAFDLSRALRATPSDPANVCTNSALGPQRNTRISVYIDV